MKPWPRHDLIEAVEVLQTLGEEGSAELQLANLKSGASWSSRPRGDEERHLVAQLLNERHRHIHQFKQHRDASEEHEKKKCKEGKMT